jgi:hypothetical protein
MAKAMTAQVTIDLSEAQLLELGKRMADLETLSKQKSEKAAEIAKDYREQIKKLDEECLEIAAQIQEKKKLETVKVKEIPDIERGLMLTVRLDDERQIIQKRGLTLTEKADLRQLSFAERQQVLEGTTEETEVPEEKSEQKIVKLNRSRRKKGKGAKADEPTTPEDRETEPDLETSDTEPPAEMADDPNCPEELQ